MNSENFAEEHIEETVDFFQNLWDNYNTEIIAACKVLLLTAVSIVICLVILKVIKKLIYKAVAKLPQVDDSMASIFYSVSRVFIWMFALLIILDLCGINTASILTMLGAAGLAVGLAMKDSLSNIAAGVMLLVQKPYKTGDYVECGSVSGSIKKIGLFSTELITVDGLFVLVPNGAIFGSPIKNYSRNPLRRADITVGIAYGDSLSQAMEVLQKLMADESRILQDPIPEVLVAELADNSVNLTLRFWTSSENYWDVFWAIKSQLKPVIENAGLNIPFPQRVITFASALPESVKNNLTAEE